MLFCCLVGWVVVWLLCLLAFRFACAFDCFGSWLAICGIVDVVVGLLWYLTNCFRFEVCWCYLWLYLLFCGFGR